MSNPYGKGIEVVARYRPRWAVDNAAHRKRDAYLELMRARQCRPHGAAAHAGSLLELPLAGVINGDVSMPALPNLLVGASWELLVGACNWPPPDAWA